VLVLLVAFLGWWFRYWPLEHIVSNFFAAIQKQDYNTAYGIWMREPDWKQHCERCAKYPFNEFYRDWGPGGDWGLVKTYKVYGSRNCPGGGGGIVFDVVVNNRPQHAQIWVKKSSKTLSYPPCELMFR